MKKEYTEYIPGHINEKGEFLGNYWESSRDKARAENRAVEHVKRGETLFQNWGLDFTFKPAIVTREVYHVESEPEVVG